MRAIETIKVLQITTVQLDKKGILEAVMGRLGNEEPRRLVMLHPILFKGSIPNLHDAYLCQFKPDKLQDTTYGVAVLRQGTLTLLAEAPERPQRETFRDLSD